MRKKKTETKVEKKEVIIEPKKEVKIEPKKEIPDFYMLGVGETISDVAKKFGISEAELKQLNGDTVIGGNQIKMRSN